MTTDHPVPTGDAPVVYENATVYTNVLVPPIADGAVLVEGGSVTAVGPRHELELPGGTAHTDLSGAVVLPGLVDSHQHVATPPDHRTASALLEREVHGGVTSVRVMADDLRLITELARAGAAGELVAPDIRSAALFAGPSFFDDERVRVASLGHEPGTAPWMQAIRDDTDLADAVARARGAGAHAVKVYADLEPELVERIVRAAREQGLLVWAHGAVFPTGPGQVVRAGVDSVSHAVLLGYEGGAVPRRYARPRADVDTARFASGTPREVDALLADMARRDCVLDSTLFVHAYGGDIAPEMATAARITARAADLGVVVSAGTDFPTTPEDPFPALFRELDLLVEHAGFSPARALAAATTGGAAALGRRGAIGRIVAGGQADLIVLAEDPTTDLAALRTITMTVGRGRRFDRADFDPEARVLDRTAPV